jgi:hypothetical protein
MKLNNVRWGLAITGLLAAEASLIAAAFAWVAIYSYLVNPGQTAAFYEQYAESTTPYLALLLGIPAFFITCRWIRSRAPIAARPTALAVFGLFCLLEISTMLAFDNLVVTPWFEAINLPVKLLSCLWGARTAQKPA